MNGIQPDNKKRSILLVWGVLLLGLFVLGISLGSVHIPIKETIKVILGYPTQHPAWEQIIWQLRLPRSLSAILVGMALSAAGLLMQTLFRNPLAGPYVLGISSGASLGVAVLLLAGGVGLGMAHPWGGIAAAIAGSGLLMLVILFFSIRIKENVSLLITGIMLASITGAVVGLLQYFSRPDALKSFVLWTFGDLGGIRMRQLKYLMPVILVALAVGYTMIKSLDAALLGDEAALNAGFNPQKTRLKILILTAVLAGSATAFAGPVAFVGLAVPHIVRRTLRTPVHGIVWPGVILTGGIVLLACDMIARLPGLSYSLPLNVVTSLFGAPVVIAVIMGENYRK